MNIPPNIPSDRPVLIAGPTASGKSELALRIAESQGGVIVNADASQVYGCWRVLTARPSVQDELRAPHKLYGHVDWRETYSAGQWLREVRPLLNQAPRPIIVGGTGLYFQTLVTGMAEIPPTPAEVRATGDKMTLEDLCAALDDATKARIDLANRARVQRAWEVLTATGRALADWQDDTPPPALPLERAFGLVFDVDKAWLEDRIRLRFDHMLKLGALDEVEAMMDRFDPSLPAFKAIGVRELVDHLNGESTLDQARERASIATRQFAKRQRTWFRSKMGQWNAYAPTS